MGFLFGHIGYCDLLLMAVVSAMGTFAAYLRHPKWKSFLIILPIPFTIAMVDVGKPLGTANVAALFLLQMYYYGVVRLHRGRGVNILAAIAMSAGGYCLCGMLLPRLLPSSEVLFWIMLAVLEAFAFVAYARHPVGCDEGHRTPLTPWLKIPAIASVVFLLVSAKSLLQGFMPLFPMVGVVASYEGRRSLGVMSRQNLFFLMIAGPMFAAIFETQKFFGLYWALAAGWIVYLSALAFTRRMWIPRPDGK